MVSDGQLKTASQRRTRINKPTEACRAGLGQVPPGEQLHGAIPLGLHEPRLAAHSEKGAAVLDAGGQQLNRLLLRPVVARVPAHVGSAVAAEVGHSRLLLHLVAAARNAPAWSARVTRRGHTSPLMNVCTEALGMRRRATRLFSCAGQVTRYARQMASCKSAPSRPGKRAWTLTRAPYS
jgi:hypothetical protein